MVKHVPKALKISVHYLLGPKSPVKFEHFGKSLRTSYLSKNASVTLPGLRQMYKQHLLVHIMTEPNFYVTLVLVSLLIPIASSGKSSLSTHISRSQNKYGTACTVKQHRLARVSNIQRVYDK